MVISTPDKPKAFATSAFVVEGADFLISTSKVVAGVITLEPPGALSFTPLTFSPVKVSTV